MQFSRIVVQGEDFLGFFDKIREGLAKTKKNISVQLSSMFASFTGANEEFFEELEETLILADLGVETVEKAVTKLREVTKREGYLKGEDIERALEEILTELIDIGGGLKLATKPSVILMIGVNGVGKTTTIGKLAMKYKNEGKKVLLCAGDTFRAAAAEQLTVWAQRAGADIVRHEEGSDPASVIFDGIAAAKARGADVIICDTAGRLHNKANLMNELNKISRIIDRELPGADRETLLVIDATTGQNGLIQAREFKETAGITGLVLTKLDGTAKGGIVFAIADRLQVPVKLIGVGEKPEDLLEFEAGAFVEALLK
jgi:fused signal recognition particle receptor